MADEDKARLVAKGVQQRANTDFVESFAPTVAGLYDNGMRVGS